MARVRTRPEPEQQARAVGPPATPGLVDPLAATPLVDPLIASGPPVQRAKWKWTEDGWVGVQTLKKDVAPLLKPGGKKLGKIYDDQTQEWEEPPKEKEVKDPKVKPYKDGKQKGRFVGPGKGVHIHIVSDNTHIKFGGDGPRTNFDEKSLDGLLTAQTALLESEMTQAPGYKDCKIWLEQEIKKFE